MRNGFLPGTKKIAQDRGLLLGQPDLVALGIEQDLGTGPERVGADREYGILARFVLAKLRADPRQQNRELPPAGLARSADLPRTVRTGRSRCLRERGRGRR